MAKILPTHFLVGEQAVQVVRLLSGGKSQDVECFMDLAFDQQELISNAATEDMTRLEVREILGEWATSSSSMSVHQFNRYERDVRETLKHWLRFKQNLNRVLLTARCVRKVRRMFKVKPFSLRRSRQDPARHLTPGYAANSDHHARLVPLLLLCIHLYDPSGSR